MISPGSVSFEQSPLDERVAVLVVDDDPDIRETLRDVIEMEGFAVVTAADGREAMDRLRMGLRPSLIVLDLMMPRMSGWDLLTALRLQLRRFVAWVADHTVSGGVSGPAALATFATLLDDGGLLRLAEARWQPALPVRAAVVIARACWSRSCACCGSTRPRPRC